VDRGTAILAIFLICQQNHYDSEGGLKCLLAIPALGVVTWEFLILILTLVGVVLGTLEDFIFPSRVNYIGNLSSRQYARLGPRELPQ
jgi:hypothetical protein